MLFCGGLAEGKVMLLFVVILLVWRFEGIDSGMVVQMVSRKVEEGQKSCNGNTMMYVKTETVSF